MTRSKELLEAEELTTEWSEYIDLEGTELSEYWSAIKEMCRHTDIMGADFQSALCVEILRIDTEMKEDFEIVEREEVIPSVRTRRVRELVWKNE